jgi:hypothetical protein
MACNGDKALSSSLRELFADDIAVAISEDAVEGVMKAGLGRENMSTVYVADASETCVVGCAGPTSKSRGTWLTNDARASTN